MSVAIPDYAEPCEGWRLWRFRRVGCQLRLLSLVQETIWPPREELTADCLRRRLLARLRSTRRHEAPAEPCACGIYATSLDRLATHLRECDDRRTAYVFGRVHLWGTVIECQQGWRAARAYPAEIMVPTPPRDYPAGIMAPAPGTGASAEEIADGLGVYAVPLVVLPHHSAEAVEVVASERGLEGRIGSGR